MDADRFDEELDRLIAGGAAISPEIEVARRLRSLGIVEAPPSSFAYTAVQARLAERRLSPKAWFLLRRAVLPALVVVLVLAAPSVIVLRRAPTGVDDAGLARLSLDRAALLAARTAAAPAGSAERAARLALLDAELVSARRRVAALPAANRTGLEARLLALEAVRADLAPEAESRPTPAAPPQAPPPTAATEPDEPEAEKPDAPDEPDEPEADEPDGPDEPDSEEPDEPDSSGPGSGEPEESDSSGPGSGKTEEEHDNSGPGSTSTGSGGKG